MKPTMAKFELTKNCNANCVFCFAGSNKGVYYPDMSFHAWKEIGIKIKNFGVKILNLSGGELFLHKDFERLVKFYKELGFKIFLNTNGTFSVENILPYLDKEDMIIFSIHSLGEQNDKITGVKNAFEMAAKNVLTSCQSKVQTAINMVLIKSNFDMVEEEFNYFNEYGIDKFSAFIPFAFLPPFEMYFI